MRSTIRPLIFASLLMYSSHPAFADMAKTDGATEAAVTETQSMMTDPATVIATPSIIQGQFDQNLDMGMGMNFGNNFGLMPMPGMMPVVPDALFNIPPGSLPTYAPSTLMNMPPAPFYIVDIPLPDDDIELINS